MKTWKIKIHVFAQAFFQYLLITYLILLLIETLKEGFVSFFFNLNILLVVILINGFIIVLTHHDKLEAINFTSKKITRSDVEYTVTFALGGALLVYFLMQELGVLSFILAALTAVIIIFLSLLLFFEQKKA